MRGHRVRQRAMASAPDGTIPVMSAQDDQSRIEGSSKPDEDGAGFLASQQTRETTSWFPWIIAAAVIILGFVILVIAGGRGSTNLPSAGTGLAPADPYAVHLAITNLQMSEAASFSGAKVTYVDGYVSNGGDQTVQAITVQVGFHSDTGEFAQRLALPLSLIRTREPYVDTQPVSAAPIAPGQKREFRLIFDSVPAEWNQQYPDIRIIGVQHTQG